jgi:ribonucleoside-diphosphate reductase alpha chain
MLPSRRSSIRSDITFGADSYHITQGFYPDGRIGEIFVDRIHNPNITKIGSPLDAACKDAAIILSVLLQYGGDLRTLKHSITRDEDNQPMSIIGAIIDSLEEPRVEEEPSEDTKPRHPPSPDQAASATQGELEDEDSVRPREGTVVT